MKHFDDFFEYLDPELKTIQYKDFFTGHKVELFKTNHTFLIQF